MATLSPYLQGLWDRRFTVNRTCLRFVVIVNKNLNVKLLRCLLIFLLGQKGLFQYSILWEGLDIIDHLPLGNVSLVGKHFVKTVYNAIGLAMVWF